MLTSSRFFIVASGQAEVISKGSHGEDLRIALLGDGEYFGEADLLDEQESTVSVRAITPTVFLGLKLKELVKFIKEVPDFRETFNKAVDKQLRLKASVNDNGEKHIDLVSGHEEDNIIPETYIDYEENPTEYSLNTLQTVVRVHTRVSDLSLYREHQGASGVGAYQQQAVRSFGSSQPSIPHQHTLRQSYT